MSSNPDARLVPWKEFLTELDSLLDQPVSLTALGGFVMIAKYGFARPTNDIDYFTLVPVQAAGHLESLAGQNSELARRFGLHLHAAAITTLPEDYEERLEELLPGEFKNLKILVLDPYDLILSKLERNIDRDRHDVKYLARTLNLDAAILRERYFTEFRPICIGRPEYHDQTLEFWLEEYFPPPSK